MKGGLILRGGVILRGGLILRSGVILSGGLILRSGLILRVGLYSGVGLYTGWAYMKGGLIQGWLIRRVGQGWAHVLMQGGLIISCKYVYVPSLVLERR